MQWILLQYIYTKQSKKSENVDWKLDWMVSTAFFPTLIRLITLSLNPATHLPCRYKKWGQKDPHRTAEDLAFSVARFFQYNGVLQNYYMVELSPT
jgi:hypothetical protein